MRDVSRYRLPYRSRAEWIRRALYRRKIDQATADALLVETVSPQVCRACNKTGTIFVPPFFYCSLHAPASFRSKDTPNA